MQSDLKDSSLHAYRLPAILEEQEQQQPVNNQPKKTKLYSLTSFALLCALSYIAYDCLVSHGTSAGAGYRLLSSGGHRAAVSPSPNAPYNHQPSSSALPAHAGPSCHVLDNGHADHFFTSVCCNAGSPPSATLWVVRNQTLGFGAEDLRIKAHGVREQDRAGRIVGSSKLDRPLPEADGYTYRYDFSIPPVPTSDDELETFVPPTLNVWYQTTQPIIDTRSTTPKRYARLFDQPVNLSVLGCVAPPQSGRPLSLRIAKH